MLYLDGLNGNNRTFLGGGYYGRMSDANVSNIVDRLIQERKIKPLIVVCPDTSGIGAPEKYLLGDILSFVDATFHTIQKRESRAIAGHSIGGYVSLYMTIAHPEVFSIAGAFSSVNMQYLQTQLPELLITYNQKSEPIRFWLYAGRNDPNAVPQPNRDFMKALKESGFPAEYIEDDGDHESRVAQRVGEFIEYLSNHLKWQS